MLSAPCSVKDGLTDKKSSCDKWERGGHQGRREETSEWTEILRKPFLFSWTRKVSIHSLSRPLPKPLQPESNQPHWSIRCCWSSECFERTGVDFGLAAGRISIVLALEYKCNNLHRKTQRFCKNIVKLLYAAAWTATNLYTTWNCCADLWYHVTKGVWAFRVSSLWCIGEQQCRGWTSMCNFSRFETGIQKLILEAQGGANES